MKNTITLLKNKYLLTFLGLTLWVLFFDKNDLSTQIKLHQQVTQLEDEKNYFTTEITSISDDIKELSSNPKTLEKFAREKYLMKCDNEDIFVIVEEVKK